MYQNKNINQVCDNTVGTSLYHTLASTWLLIHRMYTDTPILLTTRIHAIRGHIKWLSPCKFVHHVNIGIIDALRILYVVLVLHRGTLVRYILSHTWDASCTYMFMS